MKKVILIRRSSPSCYQFSSELFQSNYHFIKLRNIWDNTFNTSYEDYRNKLHEIQKENIKEIIAKSGCSVMYLYELEDLKQLSGKLVLPVDDDDWFVDNIFEELEKFETSDNYTCRWSSWRLSYYSLINCPITFVNFSKNKFHYLSNNYSIKSPNSKNHLSSHEIMNDEYIKGLHDDESYFSNYLSLHNVHLGSLSFLRNMMKNHHNEYMSSLLNCFKELPCDYTNTYFDKFVFKLYDLYKTMKIKFKFL